ncbi:MAG TPA: hypothetical protein VFU86_17245 [Terriglobales bacterium]|nr:hypothetical protein [Terriglobales bacterium]
MGFVYCTRRGTENVFRIGTTENLPTEKKHSTKEHWVIETDEPKACEAFLVNYYGTRRLAHSKDCFTFNSEDIAQLMKVADGFVKRFIPAQKAVETLSQQQSEAQVVSPGDRERDIHRRLRELREEEYRIARRRELLELELKIMIGTAAGLDGLALWRSQNQSRFDQLKFKSDNPSLYRDYVRAKLVRRFQLL